MTNFRSLRILIVFAMVVGLTEIAVAQTPPGKIRWQINVNDESGVPLACRIHLTNSQGKPQKAFGQPYWNDHFVCSGRVAIDLEPGDYRFEIERGPEYERKSGKIKVDQDSAKLLRISLARIATLRESGWYSGDLHVHRPVEQIERLMQAEDLDFAPVITWWNQQNPWKDLALPEELTRRFDGHRIYNVMAGEDEREGGALLFFGLPKPLRITGARREVPSPMTFVADAKRNLPTVWIDIEKPFWWDVPLWLASGQMQSIGIANNHMCRSLMLENEAWGKPRQLDRLPSPRGNGFWSQEIYYHMLNCGLNIPPSAGSASGVLPNPVGYNRVYVNLGEQPFTRQNWYEALARGKSFVTNGPLLIVRAAGQLPGHRMQIPDDGKSVPLEVALTSIDHVSRIEVIQNGSITKVIPCTSDLHQSHQVELEMEGAGWFLVRAIADVENTFRFASTAPWFVETESRTKRISKASAQFFLDWTRERIGRIQQNVTDREELREVLGHHEKAEAYWLRLKNGANAP